MIKVGIVSLGCSKNLIDSEMMLAMFDTDQYKLTNNPEEADVIIVNTCGFIQDAKTEAIETILEMAQYKGKLVAVGCFVQRNLEELKKEIPEVDLWVKIDDYKNLHEEIGRLLGKDDLIPMNPLRRVVSTSPYMAYLRISEGCDNFCSFCAIPYIRGRFKSRPFEEILMEARQLKDSGVKELSIVSQDTLSYGKDLKGENIRFIDLLKELDAMGFYSIRLLYLYPDELNEELLDYIKGSKSIAHYFDIPVQCASDNLLKRMNRHGNAKEQKDIFLLIKEKMPDAILRTTLISGFPGETEEDQKETIEFLKDIRFDHLGDFTYSREEGTAAYKYKDQIDPKVKEQRKSEIMECQRKISYEQCKKHVGEIMEGIVTGYDPSKKLYTLRSYWNAPDDIDGNIYFTSNDPLSLGDIVKVKITSSFIYDLMGEKA